jgi:alkanesulfonate monooxygenase SsuD/methylene tetrahydromethanopterin reductase-like flavin-dependent oxidoreductase (luciferase family)
LRLAEDYAMADILTGGRVIFGVGRGYHTREVETFGSPLLDQNANREMFEEGVEVLFKAFEGKPFSHQGKYYTRLYVEGDHPGAGAAAAAGRMPRPIQNGSERASTSWRNAASAAARAKVVGSRRLATSTTRHCHIRIVISRH